MSSWYKAIYDDFIHAGYIGSIAAAVMTIAVALALMLVTLLINITIIMLAIFFS